MSVHESKWQVNFMLGYLQISWLKALLAASVLVCSTLPNLARAQMCEPLFAESKGFLYVIEDDHPKTFLLGCHHFASVDKLPKFIVSAVEQADTVYFEGDVTPGQEEQMARVQESIFDLEDLEGPPLDEALSKRAWEILVSDLSKTDFPPDLISLLNPGGAWLLWSAWHGRASQHLEAELAKRVLAKGHRVRALGTPEEQIQIIKSFQLADLESALIHFDETSRNATDYFKLLEETYYTGDAQAMLDLHSEYPAFNSSTQQALLEERNRKWMDTILATHAQGRGSTVFGVGVMHLFGENGLIALLEAKGFKVRRIEPDK